MDLYGVLGLRAKATPAEIRRAYQKRLRLWHPDVNPGDPAAVEQYGHLQRAFEVLSDAARRALYDQGGDPFAETGGVRLPEIGFTGFDFSRRARPECGSFQELFDGMLPGSALPLTAERGEDLEQQTQIGFEDAFSGTRQRLQLVRQERCSACDGRGDRAFAGIACPQCGGVGHVQAARGHMVFKRACGACHGSGRLDRLPCEDCGAAGRVMHAEWLEVQIPPGVESGSRLRLPGCGNAGRRGGPPGDFVLRVDVAEHPVFRREGADLRCEVPVTMMEAALGAHIEVATPDGELSIEVPAGTQTGQQFRLRKRGFPRLGQTGRGDLYVVVRVVVPRFDDERSRSLLRELRDLHPANPRRVEGGSGPEPRSGASPRGSSEGGAGGTR